jgi:hypothetical protein
MSPLTSYRQIATMANPAIRTEVHQPFDRLLHVASQIALNLAILIDNLPNSNLLVGREIVAFTVYRYIGLGEYLMSGRAANAIDIGKRDFHPLVSG